MIEKWERVPHTEYPHCAYTRTKCTGNGSYWLPSYLFMLQVQPNARRQRTEEMQRCGDGEVVNKWVMDARRTVQNKQTNIELIAQWCAEHKSLIAYTHWVVTLRALTGAGILRSRAFNFKFPRARTISITIVFRAFFSFFAEKHREALRAQRWMNNEILFWMKWSFVSVAVRKRKIGQKLLGAYLFANRQIYNIIIRLYLVLLM